MARNIDKRTIDGLTFTLQQMPGRAAGRLFVKLSKNIIPGLTRAGAALESMDLSKGLDSEIDLSGAAGALSSAADYLFEHFSEKEWDELLDLLLDTCQVDDGKTNRLLMPVFDDVMAGRVMTQLKLVKFALELNFQDFMSGPGAGFSAIAEAVVSKLQKSTTSAPTGPAGAS